MSILTTRNLATRLLAVPRLTAGIYYTDISYTTRSNESKLNEGLSKRFQVLAFENGGTLVSTTIARPNPGRTVFTLSFRFQNRGQVLTFTQRIGNSHEANSMVVIPDAAALVALP